MLVVVAALALAASPSAGAQRPGRDEVTVTFHLRLSGAVPPGEIMELTFQEAGSMFVLTDFCGGAQPPCVAGETHTIRRWPVRGRLVRYILGRVRYAGQGPHSDRARLETVLDTRRTFAGDTIVSLEYRYGPKGEPRGGGEVGTESVPGGLPDTGGGGARRLALGLRRGP
jgi:hypothetical protein